MFISLIKFFLDPFNILWTLAFTSILAWYAGRRRLLKVLLYTLTTLFLLFSTPLIPVLMLNSLEDCYEPIKPEQISDPEVQYHIVILGGGHGFDDRLPANSLLSQKALGRLNEGIRLHRQLPNSKLVLSGFSESGRTTQAEMLQQTALLLGVKERATILLKKPGNTREEAESYLKRFGNTNPVILVTSAVHMPRAMQMLERLGLKPLASPTNYRLKGSWKQKWLGLPSAANIENLRMSIYEYAGIAWYDLKYGS